jgi:hypothetical protein
MHNLIQLSYVLQKTCSEYCEYIKVKELCPTPFQKSLKVSLWKAHRDYATIICVCVCVCGPVNQTQGLALPLCYTLSSHVTIFKCIFNTIHQNLSRRHISTFEILETEAPHLPQPNFWEYFSLKEPFSRPVMPYPEVHSLCLASQSPGDLTSSNIGQRHSPHPCRFHLPGNYGIFMDLEGFDTQPSPSQRNS